MENYPTKSMVASHLTTSAWISKDNTKLLSPYLPEFHELILEPLMQRAQVGAPQDRLANDLYAAIHPWLTRFIARKSRFLPATADLGELESRVHEAALLACRSLDWNRTETFAPLLRMRIEGAAIEAARHDDWLSRRHRKMLNAFKAEVDSEEQKIGRNLNDQEKREIAKKLSPEGARINWESDLQRQFAPTGWSEAFDNQMKDPHSSPEDACMENEYHAIVRQWLDSLPEGVGEAAYEWASTHVDGHRGAPRPIMRKLKKYLPTLMEMLGPHMSEASLTVDI
ncbi:MAG: hypothetical protein U0R17_03415 [Acidimicrobiia bacterium]